MNSRIESAAAYNVVYEDIEPFFEWNTEDNFHVLVVMLPGMVIIIDVKSVGFFINI